MATGIRFGQFVLGGHFTQYYCTISINSPGTVTRDAPDENMEICRDMYCVQNFRQSGAAGNEKFLY